MQDNLKRLEEIYRRLPAVPCKGCGACCVTPHMTLVEFIFLLRGMLSASGPDAVLRLLTAPMEPSPAFAGNFRCLLQADRCCVAHPWRPLACRLEGLPVMDRMGFRRERICPHITDAEFDEPVEREDVERVADAVYELNDGILPVPREPYFLDALNLECWLALLLDPGIDQPWLQALRALVGRSIDLASLRVHYRDRAGLAAKLARIDRFFAACENGDYQAAREHMRAVVHDFPRTGTHFRAQGPEYLRLVERMAARARAAAGGGA